MGRCLVIVFLCFFSLDSLSCSCVFQPDDLEEAVMAAYESVSSVVLAQVESVSEAKSIKKIAQTYEFESEVTQFTEIKSWKGQHGKHFETNIITSCCMCGMSFEKGQTYLLYLDGPDANGHYSTSICTRTAREENALEDIKILDGMRNE